MTDKAKASGIIAKFADGADESQLAASSECNGAGFATFPALPRDMTRTDCMDGLRAVRDLAVEAQRRRESSFVRWPDIDALLDWIDANGFPAPEKSANDSR